MILAFDIGNTTIGIGLFEADSLTADFAIPAHPAKSRDEYIEILSGFLESGRGRITRAVISSVVPALTPVFAELGAHFAGGAMPLIVTADCLKPAEGVDISKTGADRIAGMAGATVLFRPPLVIVDMGTATTFSVVDGAGRYAGGAIAPGLVTGAKALFEKTAQLKDVTLKPVDSVIGKDTASCLLSGIIAGHASMVDGMLERMAGELGAPDVKFIAAGGNSGLVVPQCKSQITVKKHLTLEGLNIIAKKFL